MVAVCLIWDMPNCFITRRWILVYLLVFLRFELLRLVWEFPSWRVARRWNLVYILCFLMFVFLLLNMFEEVK